jgi:C4-dicarboxylate-specific signal transduction histidine kinase
MNAATGQPPDEVRRLQGCINDLISIQAFPAIWSGRDARQIVTSLLDVLIRTLHLDFAGARVNDPNGGAPIEAVRLPLERSPALYSDKRKTLEVWLSSAELPARRVTANPMGTGNVTLVPCRLGVQDEIGFVLAASERIGFPTELEMVVLRVAANQAVVGLQEARVLKRAEDRLRRSEAQLAEGQKLSHSGSWGWNVSSGECIFSQETFHILGFDPEQPAPTVQTALDRIHPDDRKLVERILESAVRDKSDFSIEARLLLPDRSVRYFDSVGRPLINGSGDLEFIGTILDITDRKNAEEKLELAQSQLSHMARVTTMGELAASIAHEMNQPLAAVVTDGSAALRWLSGPEPNLEEARDALARIVKEANRAGHVLAGVRAFMKKSQPNKATVHMNEVIGEVLALTRHQILRNGVTIMCDLEAELRDIQGDAIQLQQVLVNLLVNAMEAMDVMPEGQRQLYLSTENKGEDRILVGVQDSGVGLDPDVAEDMFKPFVSGKAGGMGMGLAISRTIVETHGGRLWAEPNQNRGATFWFSLPIAGAMLRLS